jgi:hypothetical protein
MMKDKRHIIVVFSIIAGIIIIGLIAGKIMQPESFGLHGHFRWNAVNELQKQEVINQDISTCGKCHDDIYQLHQKDAHYNVPCVDCHGAGNLHTLYYGDEKSKDTIKKELAVMKKEYNLEGCLYCHRKLKARPSDFPQINQEEHYKFLKVNDLKTKCIECHSPHEPVFLLTDAKNARLHPIVYKCTECHDKTPEKSPKEVLNHPTIFECKDCHAELVKDFSERPHHKYIDCRTCHLYHKENETTGRIYKNGNSKFCLLCHEKKPFKDDKYPPKIEWPSHAGGNEVIAKSDEKICLNCHEKQIHRMDLVVKANPHPDNWKGTHREFARQKSELCSSCHAPGFCQNCHMKSRPASHTGAWRKQHPKFAAGNQWSCELCHGKNACISCHKVDIPHPKDWDEKHKDVVSQKGKNVCYNCHKEDFCKQCH